MPRQFEVFQTTNRVYVIVLQADTLNSLATRVVARLVPDDWPDPPFKHLSPSLTLGDIVLRLHATQIATLTTKELGTYVGSASHQRDDIIRATDLLLTGY